MGPLPQSNAIYPTTNLTFVNGEVIGNRTNPDTLPGDEVPGRSDLFGYEGFYLDSRQIVTLPGSGFFGFADEWQPVLTTDPNGFSGPSSQPGTYNYEPISGQRDLLGFIRAPQPGEHRRRLRQQPVHGHRCLPVRQPASAGSHRRDRDPLLGSHAGHVLHPRHLARRSQHHPVDDQHHLQRPA